MNQTTISDSFRRRIEGLDENGRRWLDELPQTIDSASRRWNLRVGPPLDVLSYNYLAPAELADGRRAFLKLGVPRPELQREAAALRVYAGRGSVKLIDADPAAGILLLERLDPGQMLAELCPHNDEEATRIAAQAMKRLWRPVSTDHGFKTVAQWAEGFERLRGAFKGGTGPFPKGLVKEAESIYGRFLADTKTDFLLHGDLHHFNILSADREPWLAVDPKGVVGDPAYDTGALLRNPVPDVYNWADLATIQSTRLDILAEELQIERRRIRDWAFAQLVLSAWWSYEDEGLVQKEWIPFAELLKAS